MYMMCRQLDDKAIVNNESIIKHICKINLSANLRLKLPFHDNVDVFLNNNHSVNVSPQFSAHFQQQIL